jgi:hypothetical protein
MDVLLMGRHTQAGTRVTGERRAAEGFAAARLASSRVATSEPGPCTYMSIGAVGGEARGAPEWLHRPTARERGASWRAWPFSRWRRRLAPAARALLAVPSSCAGRRWRARPHTTPLESHVNTLGSQCACRALLRLRPIGASPISRAFPVGVPARIPLQFPIQPLDYTGLLPIRVYRCVVWICCCIYS